MRRRPPHTIALAPEDRTALSALIQDGRTEQRIARRARILLAMADPNIVIQPLAEHLEVARNTIWSLCRRYESIGVEAVFDAPRTGRPWRFSPSGAGQY